MIIGEDRNMGQDAGKLRLMHRAVAEDVLGPGRRAILWVQGCPHRCPGCIAPEGWTLNGGTVVSVEEVAEWVLAQPGIEGITISGGEPMLQAAALARLIRLVRARVDLGAMCYTGYVLPPRPVGEPGVSLRRTPARRDLISMLDLLIDGPYVESRHADLLWRGSDNQRVIVLTDRYVGLFRRMPDRSAGIVCVLDPEGRPQVIGVPSRPRFREELERRLGQNGVCLTA